MNDLQAETHRTFAEEGRGFLLKRSFKPGHLYAKIILILNTQN